MDFLKRMTEAINYIETNITTEIHLPDLAKIVHCDAYQFGRIFSYVVGVSLAEYVRNRRLSLAAIELQTGQTKVIDAALKFGYNSPESFARAFREMHGVPPKEAQTKGATLKMYPKISFQISIKGAVDMNYRIEEKEAIKCVGGVYLIPTGDKSFSELSNGYDYSWGKFLDSKDEKLGKTPNEVVRDDYKLYRAPLYQVGLAHVAADGNTIMSIGAEADGREYPGLDLFEIPAATWAMFSGKGKVYEGLDAMFTRIFSEWLPSSGYEHAMNYTVEIYPPGNSQSDDYAFEIWIPVKKK